MGPCRLLLPGRIALAMGCGVLLASCGGPGKPVAAKVNGRDIPVARIVSSVDEGAGREASLRALDRLIDQELLVQAAEREHLDRDPQVRKALEEARRQVLAQSYVDRSVAGAGEGASDEVHNYYGQNPALFAQRRIYRIRELAVDAPSEKIASLTKVALSAEGLDEVAGWLRGRKLPFSLTSVTKPAEEIPLPFLPRLAGMSDGERAVFMTPSGASVIEVIESQAAGLSEAQAAPVIEHFLASRRRLQSADAAIARLRSAAAIEYRGGYRTGAREVGVQAEAGTPLPQTEGLRAVAEAQPIRVPAQPTRSPAQPLHAEAEQVHAR